MHGMDWGFDNTFARKLDWLGAAVDPVPVSAPSLPTVNDSLALELGLDPQWLASTDGVAHLAGNAVPEGAQPRAQAYAGHQFGQFSPLLGDGRAHLLGEVVDEIVLTVRPLLKRGDVAISVDVAQGLSMDSFPGPLGQVITNLISNAVTHAFEDCDDRRVTIAATPDGDEAVCVTLADNGNGIPDTLLPRIFDPFVTTRMGRGGVGLGLHICHNLVMQTLGGRIAVASTPGVGTTFTLTLPTCAPAPSAANEQSAHA